MRRNRKPEVTGTGKHSREFDIFLQLIFDLVIVKHAIPSTISSLSSLDSLSHYVYYRITLRKRNVLIHFAFGSLGKQGLTTEQTEKFINLVLKEKRLQVSKCVEFIPVLPIKGDKRIPIEMFKSTGEAYVSATFYPRQDPNWLEKLPDDTKISYLPVDVSMICFIRITFNQLGTSGHHREYGKLGLILTTDFLTSHGAKPVSYYSEKSVWQDVAVKKWNYELHSLSKQERLELENEIVSYRKPAVLLPSFKEKRMKLTGTTQGVALEFHPKYERYPIGYDFERENEVRIVFLNEEQYLYFEERDLYMIIAPDPQAKRTIESFLYQYYTKRPAVKLYPA